MSVLDGYELEGGPATPDPETVAAHEYALLLNEAREHVTPRIIPVASPAAGSDFTIAVPAGTVWWVESIVATLTTGVGVANRDADLIGTDGTTTFLRIAAPALQVASQVVRYSWVRGDPGGAPPAPPASWQVGFPSIPILGGTTLQVSTAGIQAADQWSAIALYALQVRERSYAEMADYARQVVSGARVDTYAGVRLGS